MKYTVTGNIKHNGKLRKRGAEIELDEADAAPLLRDGFLAVVPMGDDKPAPAKKGGDK